MLGNEDTTYIKLTTPAYKKYETRKPRIANVAKSKKP